MNKYKFISSSGIKKKKRKKKDNKIEIIKDKKKFFEIGIDHYGLVEYKRNSLKNRINEIVEELKILRRNPRNSIISCNTGTIGLLRTYYGYSVGSAGAPQALCDYKINIDDKLDNKILASCFINE